MDLGELRAGMRGCAARLMPDDTGEARAGLWRLELTYPCEAGYEAASWARDVLPPNTLLRRVSARRS